jgi:hypothetical protein
MAFTALRDGAITGIVFVTGGTLRAAARFLGWRRGDNAPVAAMQLFQ